MATLTPNMEAITIPGSISGPQVIDSLLDKIAERLSGDCSLRETDRYSGFSARVTVELQLRDVYNVEIIAGINHGDIDPAQPVRRITLGSTVEGEEEQPALERPVDPSGVTEPPPPARRLYVSGVRKRRT
jgi:hypothetical protein